MNLSLHSIKYMVETHLKAGLATSKIIVGI